MAKKPSSQHSVDAPTVLRPSSEEVAPHSEVVGDGAVALPQPAQSVSDMAMQAAASSIEIHEELGSGGLCVVRRGWQRRLERSVAVKQLHPDLKDSAALVEAFLQEARITAQLEHPGIPPVHDVIGDSAHSQQIIMQLINGQLWSHRLAEMPRAENAAILQRVAEVVAYAHAQGIVHCDLKPSNVMLGSFGEVLVIDWGLACKWAEANPAFSKGSSGVRGTPQYMSPEAARGEAPQPSMDVYGLGALLFEVVTGQRPHPYADIEEALAHARAGHLPPHHDPGSDDLLAVSLQALRSEVDDRYADVETFRAALTTALSREEARRLLLLAQSDFQQARQSEHGYEHFQRAIFRFHEALHLWPESTAGALGLAHAQASYAEFALHRGDLDLAMSLVNAQDPAHQQLSRLIEEAQHHRRLREQEAERQRIRAETAFQKAKNVNVMLIRVIREAKPEQQGHGVKLVDALTRVSDVIGQELSGDIRTRVEFRVALLETLIGSEFLKFRARLVEELHGDVAQLGINERDPLFRHFAYRLVREYFQQGKFRLALPLAEQHLQWRLHHDGDDQEEVMKARFMLAEALLECGDGIRSLAMMEEALADLLKQPSPDPAEVLFCQTELFGLLQRVGQVDRALAMVAELEQSYAHNYPDPNPQTMTFLANVMFMYIDQGRWQEAEPWAQKLGAIREILFGVDNKATINARGMHGYILCAMGREDGLVQLQRQCEDLAQHPDASPHDMVEPLMRLSRFRLREGNVAAAELHYQRALEAAHQCSAEQGRWYRPLLDGLQARIMLELGQNIAAADLALDAVLRLEQSMGAGDGRCRRLRVFFQQLLSTWADQDPAAHEQWCSRLSSHGQDIVKRSVLDGVAYPGLIHS